MVEASARSFSATAAGDSNFASLLLNSRVPCASDQFLISGSSSSFLGSRSMMSFGTVHGGKGMSQSYLYPFDEEANGDEDLDDYFHQPSKKRRLTADQVKALETSFELDKKLEPERKIGLAKDLSLQPSQVAIWFQNRRPRSKSRLLEKDYDYLQASYNGLKADYDRLQQEKEKLRAEALLLKDKLHCKEKVILELHETNKLSQELPGKTTDSASKGEVLVACKQEEYTSSKSDIVDLDSLHYADGDASHLFEPGQSDLSHDEDDNFNKSLLPPYITPNYEDASYSEASTNLCNIGFSQEENAIWYWSY